MSIPTPEGVASNGWPPYTRSMDNPLSLTAIVNAASQDQIGVITLITRKVLRGTTFCGMIISPMTGSTKITWRLLHGTASPKNNGPMKC